MVAVRLRSISVLMGTICLLAPISGASAGKAGNSVSAAQRVVEAKFDAVNRHAIAEIVAAYADDADLTATDFCTPRHGKTDVERTYRAIFAAVPDIQADVLEMVVQDDRVAVRLNLRSDIPGRSFDLALMNFFTVESGHIVRDVGVFDNRGRPCGA